MDTLIQYSTPRRYFRNKHDTQGLAAQKRWNTGSRKTVHSLKRITSYKVMDPEVKELSVRPKKFRTVESLRYEEERLATFIMWPVKHVSYKALAANGFYYLRTKDHCACVFCNGIIGAWEVGDTPQGEHKRYFPHCPMVLGKVTGNVSLAVGKILNKLQREFQQALKIQAVGKDICDSEKINDVSMESLGFKEYCRPARYDYLTVDKRENSFKDWPDETGQNPRTLAEAGFYYYGLSDHVRCFHCNNGLRNWETLDSPWGEHARWYGDCNYVLLTKGEEFIERIQRESPTFTPSATPDAVPHEEKNATSSTTPSYISSRTISEEDMDQLMHLDTIHEVVSMGFSARIVRRALKRRLIHTGLPYATVDTTISSVLEIMDEETKNVISARENAGSHTKERSSHTAPTADIPPTSTNLGIGCDIRTATQEEGADLSSLILAHISTILENTPPPMRETLHTSTYDSNNDRGQTIESIQGEAISQDGTGPEEKSGHTSTVIVEESDYTTPQTATEGVEISTSTVVNPVERESATLTPIVTATTEASLAQELKVSKEYRQCRVCMDSDRDIVFLPCTHMATCTACALALLSCPICRGDIQYVFKPIIS